MATLDTIAGGYGDALLNVASHLPARDVLKLCSVSRSLASFLRSCETSLFDQLLRRDFVEGTALSYVAETRGLSRKKLYAAFATRYDLTMRGGKRIAIHWRKFPPSSDDIHHRDRHVRSLVFIARLGINGDSNSCALMEWNADFDYYQEYDDYDGYDNRHLVVDEDWARREGELAWPRNEDLDNVPWSSQQVGHAERDAVLPVVNKTHSLSFHVIDVERYSVMSMMEEAGYVSNYSDWHPETFSFSTQTRTLLYGLPQKTSPYYREFSDEEWSQIDSDADVGYLIETVEDNNIEFMRLFGETRSPAGGISTLDAEKSLAFNFQGNFQGTNASIYYPRDVCNYLRAVMKDKCTSQVHVTIEEQPTQPFWIRNSTIVDGITSYALFEDQVGDLRLVSRQFGVSAMKHAEIKILDRDLAIGQYIGKERENTDDWFIVRAQRGWSEKHLTNKENAIDDALWLGKCRCFRCYCKDRESCTNKTESIVVESIEPSVDWSLDGSNKARPKIGVHLSDDQAREMLAEKGKIELGFPLVGENIPTNRISCSFESKSMTIFEVCHELMEAIWENVYFEDPSGQHSPRHPIPQHIQKAFGLSEIMSSDRFIKSVFLVLSKVNQPTAERPLTKQARADYEQVSIGEVWSHTFDVDWVNDSYRHYEHSKSIYRLYSMPGHQPIEICLEGTFIADQAVYEGKSNAATWGVPFD